MSRRSDAVLRRRPSASGNPSASAYRRRPGSPSTSSTPLFWYQSSSNGWRVDRHPGGGSSAQRRCGSGRSTDASAPGARRCRRHRSSPPTRSRFARNSGQSISHRVYGVPRQAGPLRTPSAVERWKMLSRALSLPCQIVFPGRRWRSRDVPGAVVLLVALVPVGTPQTGSSARRSAPQEPAAARSAREVGSVTNRSCSGSWNTTQVVADHVGGDLSGTSPRMKVRVKYSALSSMNW